MRKGAFVRHFANGLLMGKILNAAPAALPIRVLSSDKPYMSGILNDIDKSIRATARTITKSRLTDMVRSEVVLSKAGLKSLTEAVSITMASIVWKARKEMNSLGNIFNNNVSKRNTRSADDTKLCQPIPGYPEAAANRLANVWNVMNLSSAHSLGQARASARDWYKNMNPSHM